jgi:putative transposase
MPSMIELDNTEWTLVEDLFDPPAREGRPARYPRRQVVEAILFLARTGCQWRYLPACYPPWEAVWQQWRRWRERGLGAGDDADRRAHPHAQGTHGDALDGDDRRPDGPGRSRRADVPREGGRGGRTNGAKRSIVIEILGLPLAVSVESARPHDVSAGRRLLDATLPALGTVQAVVADRGYRGLGKMTAKKGIRLDIKAPPKGTVGFTPIRPLCKVEHAFARLGRWRRLSRCYEGTAESARAWLEVAALAYLFARLRVEPA